MYYDDQARGFNLVSGLLTGAIFGAGVALLMTVGLRDAGRNAP